MIIDDQMIVSQAIWDGMSAGTKAALLKCDPPPAIMSNEEWAKLGAMVRQAALEHKYPKGVAVPLPPPE